MLDLANANTAKASVENVQFLRGTIENRDRLHGTRSCDRAQQFAKLSQLGETADFASYVK